MKASIFNNNLDSARSMNRVLLMTIGGLMILLMMGSLALLKQKQTVVLVPPTLFEKGAIQHNEASPEVLSAWGLYYATLFGNVTPTTVDFLVERVGELVTPAAYHSVVNGIKEQAELIKADRLTVSFSPRNVHYEGDGWVKIEGVSIARGIRGDPQTHQRVYRIRLVVTNYIVRLDALEIPEKA